LTAVAGGKDFAELQRDMISQSRYAALIASIYEAATDFGQWPEALRLIARAYDAPAVVFAGFGRRTCDFWHMAPDVDPVQMERYTSHFHRINPLRRIAVSAAPGTVLTDAMMIPRREFERTEFFNDFLVPQAFGSMLGATVHADGDWRSHIVVQRWREFDAADIALQRRLAPHLLRAAQLNCRLAALDMRCAAEAEMLDRLEVGAVLVDAESRVLFANREAERLIQRSGSLRVTGGVLRARSASDTANLHAYVTGCRERRGDVVAGGGSLSLRVARDRPAMGVLVLPLRAERSAFLPVRRPAAIIFLTDPGRLPAPLAQRAQQQYGLTRAEVLFALEIIKGDGIQACADRLGISKSTARTHLSHIFQKVGVRRQAELVRLFVRV
jgi:DNA-binding CsgD family transcriptional regulator